MRKKFLKSIAVGLLVGSLFIGNMVSAGTTWSGSESRPLPGGNGNVLSSQQTKATAGAAGLRMNATQGYEIDVRTLGRSSGAPTGSWERNIVGGMTYSINSPQAPGQTLALQFSSNWNSPSTVINYSWRSN